jgi:hypothetical protein
MENFNLFSLGRLTGRGQGRDNVSSLSNYLKYFVLQRDILFTYMLAETKVVSQYIRVEHCFLYEHLAVSSTHPSKGTQQHDCLSCSSTFFMGDLPFGAAKRANANHVCNLSFKKSVISFRTSCFKYCPTHDSPLTADANSLESSYFTDGRCCVVQFSPSRSGCTCRFLYLKNNNSCTTVLRD